LSARMMLQTQPPKPPVRNRDTTTTDE
jgi:hypothetical protein